MMISKTKIIVWLVPYRRRYLPLFINKGIRTLILLPIRPSLHGRSQKWIFSIWISPRIPQIYAIRVSPMWMDVLFAANTFCIADSETCHESEVCCIMRHLSVVLASPDDFYRSSRNSSFGRYPFISLYLRPFFFHAERKWEFNLFYRRIVALAILTGNSKLNLSQADFKIALIHAPNPRKKK